MIKFNLIFLIGVVSAFLLTVQWIILQMAVKNASFEVNHQWVIAVRNYCGLFQLLIVTYYSTSKARQLISDNELLLDQLLSMNLDQLLIETNLLAEPDQSSQQTGNTKSRSTARDRRQNTRAHSSRPAKERRTRRRAAST